MSETGRWPARTSAACCSRLTDLGVTSQKLGARNQPRQFVGQGPRVDRVAAVAHDQGRCENLAVHGAIQARAICREPFQPRDTLECARLLELPGKRARTIGRLAIHLPRNSGVLGTARALRAGPSSRSKRAIVPYRCTFSGSGRSIHAGRTSTRAMHPFWGTEVPR